MRPTVLIIFITGLLALLLIGCRKEINAQPSYKQISQEEAKQMMEVDDGHVIVDVRRQDEYDAGHISGAILIPNESIETVPPKELPDKEQIMLIYCRSGNRSKQAAQKLADMGYTNIYEFGGINTWDGEITTDTAEEETRQTTLSLSSFDGGGPVFTVHAEDSTLLSWTQERDYGSEDPALVEGARYDVIFTFTGLREGSTRLTVEQRSPIAGNYDHLYTATVGADLSVSLEWIETHELREEEIASLPTLVIEVGDQIFYATLEDNSSAEALTEMLNEGPIALELQDYGSFEKVGPLPWALPRNDEAITTQPGDVILYQGNQLTIYYDENSWEFTKLAHIEGVTKEILLAAMGSGDVTVTLWIEWGE